MYRVSRCLTIFSTCIKENISMKKLLTLVFVAAALLFASNAVYANDAAASKAEAPIVIGPSGFGHHGLPFGEHFADQGIPGQKVSILTKIGNRIKFARAAREARKAATGAFDGGYPTPRRKLFTPRAKSGFGGGFNHGQQGFPTEFQVGGYY
jgi:hypothetical protein